MKSVLMTASASATAHLSASAFVAAQDRGDYLCARYGLGCGEGALPLVVRPGTLTTLLTVMAVVVIPALIIERRRARCRRGG